MNIQSSQTAPSDQGSFCERSIDLQGKKLIFQTGKVAKQADGAVLASMGETVILSTVVVSRFPSESQGFAPLSVSYREMFSAAGKIPGGFVKREGKMSDHEVLVSRLIDRSIRPLIAKDFNYEIQVISTVLSYDPACDPVAVAMLSASAAIAMSGVPIKEVVASTRIGMVDDLLIVNPSAEQLRSSKVDMVLTGGSKDVFMLEGSARELSEEKLADLLRKGSEIISPIIGLIEELRDLAGKKLNYSKVEASSKEDSILSSYEAEIVKGFEIGSKVARAEYFSALKSKIMQKFDGASDAEISSALIQAMHKLARASILNSGKRFGGRGLNEIREISSEVGLLPRTHGSSLFTRGDTQALASVTLGTAEDEQVVDGIYGDLRESFLLHYMFPPYSTGECGVIRAPGRREIGHGRLALKAVHPVMPEKAKFPYTVRVVAEITESDGSSSQATICATILALMDAGVPIRSMVSGIAMGLIKEGDKVAILSDIAADEDYLGDMDFKVAGTEAGITAIQMDSKIGGISADILEKALLQSKEGRLHILSQMQKTISTPRVDLSAYAPVITVITIAKADIKSLIGPGGKVIKDICEKSGSKISVSDSGEVQIGSPNADLLKLALKLIKGVTGEEAEVGAKFEGRVVKIIDSGIFVNYSGSKDGFVHISEISDTRVFDISEHVQEGDTVPVTVIGFDKGRVRLSIKACDDHSGYLRKNNAGRSRQGGAESRGVGSRGGDFRSGESRGGEFRGEPRGGEFRGRHREVRERTEFSGESGFRSRDNRMKRRREDSPRGPRQR